MDDQSAALSEALTVGNFRLDAPPDALPRDLCIYHARNFLRYSRRVEIETAIRRIQQQQQDLRGQSAHQPSSALTTDADATTRQGLPSTPITWHSGILRVEAVELLETVVRRAPSPAYGLLLLLRFLPLSPMCARHAREERNSRLSAAETLRRWHVAAHAPPMASLAAPVGGASASSPLGASTDVERSSISRGSTAATTVAPATAIAATAAATTAATAATTAGMTTMMATTSSSARPIQQRRATLPRFVPTATAAGEQRAVVSASSRAATTTSAASAASLMAQPGQSQRLPVCVRADPVDRAGLPEAVSAAIHRHVVNSMQMGWLQLCKVLLTPARLVYLGRSFRFPLGPAYVPGRSHIILFCLHVSYKVSGMVGVIDVRLRHAWPQHAAVFVNNGYLSLPVRCVDVLQFV